MPSTFRSTLITVTLVAIAGCSSREAIPVTKEAAASAWTDSSPHTAGFVTANGIQTNYLDWGGTGPNLILIHGLGDNPHVFDEIVPSLGGKFRIVAYARRGHGRSSKSGPFDTGTLTEDLKALMDSLKIAKAHLAGWSMGGNEITGMAGKYPDRVDRIVYLDGAYDWADPAAVAAFGELPVSFTPTPAALVSLDAFRSWQIGTFFPAITNPSRLEAYIRDMVDIQADGSVRPVASDSVSGALFNALVTNPRDYTKVKAPALAIYAETFLDGAHGDSAQRAKALAWEEKHLRPFRAASIARVKRELKSLEIVRVSGTHPDFMFTSRERVAEAMKGFLLVARPSQPSR
jgi:pimeloyl-ACP methyl ester carboxylesterase